MVVTNKAREQRRRQTVRGLVLVIVLLLGAAGVYLLAGGLKSQYRATAYFTAAVGLYPGSDVRVLGVVVGTVETVTPVGDRVKMELTIDEDVLVPHDANALVLSPNLVSDRYVQLTPAYEAGPVLNDEDVIPVERTVVPVELDEVFTSLDDLATALGPEGANADGALSRLITASAETFEGTGLSFNETARELGKASRTLAGAEKDLFGTVDNVQKFVSMLARNDEQVREFTGLLAKVADNLAADRKELAAALKELGSAMSEVESFIADNRENIKSNVDKLASVAKVLAKQKNALQEALHEAPEALTDLLRAYDPNSGTLHTRPNLNEFSFAPGKGVDNAPPLPLPSAGSTSGGG